MDGTRERAGLPPLDLVAEYFSEADLLDEGSISPRSPEDGRDSVL